MSTDRPQDYTAVPFPASTPEPGTSDLGLDVPQYTGGQRYMLLSDLHLDEQAGSISETIEQIGEHQEVYDADALLLAGDQLAYDSEVDGIIDHGYEIAHIVEGNHDLPDDDDDADWRYTGDGGQALLHHDTDTVRWKEVLETGELEFLMGHRPGEVGSGATWAEEQASDGGDPEHVKIYGHSHMPYDRELAGEVHIGAGSLLENYNMDEDRFPERSFHVLDVTDHGLGVTHVDFETGDVLEATFYRFDADEGLTEAASLHRWETDRHDRWDADR